MIVRLDLERASPAVADVDDARVLARALHHAAAARRQALQVHARRFVRTVLAPHHAEDAQLSKRWLALSKQLLDLFVFFGRESVLSDELRRDSQGRGQIHRGLEDYCRICRERRKAQLHVLASAKNLLIEAKWVAQSPRSDPPAGRYYGPSCQLYKMARSGGGRAQARTHQGLKSNARVASI